MPVCQSLVLILYKVAGIRESFPFLTIVFRLIDIVHVLSLSPVKLISQSLAERSNAFLNAYTLEGLLASVASFISLAMIKIAKICIYEISNELPLLLEDISNIPIKTCQMLMPLCCLRERQLYGKS